MTGRTVMGLVWAAGGILLGIQWWRARPQVRQTVVGRDPAEPSRFGSGSADRSLNRLQAMRLAYAEGAGSVAGGLLVEDLTFLLVVGAVLINLGTVFRYLVVALDRDLLHEPVLDLTGRGLLGGAVDRLAETA